jgi:hypothetical protein
MLVKESIMLKRIAVAKRIPKIPTINLSGFLVSFILIMFRRI